VSDATRQVSLSDLAERADEAARTATAIAQFTNTIDLGVADAYAVQALSVARRLGRGEQMAGIKMGLTSRAKMIQVGVDEVIWGRLTDAMRVADGGTVQRSRYVHPRVEPEIAFLIGEPLAGRVSGRRRWPPLPRSPRRPRSSTRGSRTSGSRSPT
jgi:2-oxo-3-hexenedioate decarboxylase